MARVRTLEAEKENPQPGATQNSSKLLHHTTSLPSPSSPALPSPSSLASQPSNSEMFNMLKDLQLKLEEFEAQRKRDVEEAQALRKSDAEEAQALRKRDAKEAQAQRQRDAENFEAQRGGDAKKVDAQRRKDAEKVETQDAKAQIYKLEMCVEELEYNIKRLEQNASERELERKQNDGVTQQYIESLADEIEATTDFLAVGDKAGLDRIKRRNLPDRAQASLATCLGLAQDENPFSASLHFRLALGPSSSTMERQQRLSEILLEKKDEIPPEAVLLMAKPRALELLAERHPKVRLDGDQVAHGYRQRSWYEGSVTRSVGADKVALTSLLDFVLPVGQ